LTSGIVRRASSFGLVSIVFIFSVPQWFVVQLVR